VKKNLILTLFVVLLLASCRENLPGPCECEEQVAGLLCREVRYDQGHYAGHVDYFYNALGKPEAKEYHSSKQLEKTLRYTYSSSGKIKTETIELSGQSASRYTEYLYNEADSLVAQVYFEDGIVVSRIDYHYNTSQKLSTKTLYQSGQLSQVFRFIYHDNRLLWKVLEEDAGGQVVRESHYAHYQNDVTTISYYSRDGAYLGYDLLQYRSDGQLQLEKHYNSQKLLMEYTLHEFHDQTLSRSARYNGQGKLQQQTHFIYF